jgi:hypothetical protein
VYPKTAHGCAHRCPVPALPWQGLLVTVNGNPVDYHTIHPSLPMENGPAKADLYSTPQYRWEPSDEFSGNRDNGEGVCVLAAFSCWLFIWFFHF